MSEFIVFNGALKPIEEVLISPLNRGMMYGDGFFDTLRSYAGKFLHLEEHFERTKKTAQYLGIEVHFGFEDFRSKILELLEANELLAIDALVRVQCWRGGERGYATTSNHGNWTTSSAPISSFKESIALSVVQTRVIPNNALGRIFKLSNGLNYIQAAREASELGADDAIMLTIDGKVSETTSANLFWIKENIVYTPSIDCDLLPGITRNLVIEIIKKNTGLLLKEGGFEFKELIEAESVFTTNSIREIKVVESVGQVNFDTSSPILSQIIDSFDQFKLHNLK